MKSSENWVLVIGAGFWQIPLINTVKRLGYKALAIDRDPLAPGSKVADRFEPIDITDTNETIRLAKETGIVGAVTDQTDLAVPTLAGVCQSMNIPGPSPQTAKNTTNKARMRELAANAGLMNPKYRVCSTVDEAIRAVLDQIGFPCVVKPTDSQASRGVQRIDVSENLKSACEEAFRFSREKKILVEEYISGTEVTVEGCRYGGKTHLLAVSSKKHTPPPHIIAVNLDFPAQIPEALHHEIHAVYNSLVDALEIDAGSIHGELIVNERGIYLVEMANRGGGSGTSSHMVPALSGVDLLEANVLFATGHEPLIERTKNLAGVLRFMVYPQGQVTSIQGIDEALSIAGVVTCGLYIKPGDILTPITMDTQRHGYILTSADTLQKAQAIADEVEKTIRVSIA